MKSIMTSSITIILLLVIVYFFLSKTSISFKPFSFKVTEPFRGLGWIVLVIGMAIIEYSAEKRGQIKTMNGVKKTVEEIEKIQSNAKQILEENKKVLIANKSIYEKLKQKDGK